MSKIIIAGLDPALRNVGMAKGTLDLSEGLFELSTTALAQTTKNTTKTNTVRSDDLERCKTILSAVADFVKDVDILFIELPIGSQTSAAQKSYAICIMLLAAIQHMYNLPAIIVDPKYLKQHTAGKGATKEQMISWLHSEYPHMISSFPKAKDKCEHIADAVGAIHAGVNLNEFNLLTQVYNRK
ncbi:MAG: hypothetical protein Tp152SUR00d2C52646391_23 [Prokaryotic dsDNA virus sp.]|nr:MAG: hypothetical protein Tp152SUR00d2C52646391_23 [Prokaryotic dsDNA virus sp.]|tara:strand:- start:1674 stop:2225 length:552 start_codon:yes stop_codon:yes gene_type:complete